MVNSCTVFSVVDGEVTGGALQGLTLWSSDSSQLRGYMFMVSFSHLVGGRGLSVYKQLRNVSQTYLYL